MQTVDLKCKICGKSMSARVGTKYCSQHCRYLGGRLSNGYALPDDERPAITVDTDMSGYIAVQQKIYNDTGKWLSYGKLVAKGLI